MESNKTISIISSVALGIAAICSTGYLLMLGWYNNLLLDDYGFVADVDQNGAWGLMVDIFGWQSRFSAFYVLGWIFKIWGHASNLIGYTLLLLILGYCVIYYALHSITRIPHHWLLIGLSVIITNVSIMSYFELSTFYWLCCAVYTLSSYAAITLITAIFFSQGKKWLRWLLVISSSLYICGGAENFTPVVIAGLGLVLVSQMITARSWSFWKTNQQQMILCSLLILIIGFFVVITGSGTSKRAQLFDSLGFMGHFELLPYLTALVKSSLVFLTRLLSRSLYFLVLFPIGVFVGTQMKESSNKISLKILMSAVIVLGIILLSNAASVYGIGWYAPLRAYSFVSFVISAVVLYWGILVGPRARNSVVMGLFIASLMAIAAISVYSAKTEYPMVKEYRTLIQNTDALIKEQVQSGRSETLIVEEITVPSIPNSYAILRSAMNCFAGKTDKSIAEPNTFFPYERFELSIDPSNWKNKDLQNYYNAQFEIVGWGEPED